MLAMLNPFGSDRSGGIGPQASARPERQSACAHTATASQSRAGLCGSDAAQRGVNSIFHALECLGLRPSVAPTTPTATRMDQAAMYGIPHGMASLPASTTN
jgi:hypothetical protein